MYLFVFGMTSFAVGPNYVIWDRAYGKIVFSNKRM